jgi:hypothetical protein
MDAQLLATLFSGGTLISIIVGLIRLGGMQEMLKTHAAALAAHAARMDRFDGQVMQVVGDLQRVVGRLEIRDGRQRVGD